MPLLRKNWKRRRNKVWYYRAFVLVARSKRVSYNKRKWGSLFLLLSGGSNYASDVILEFILRSTAFGLQLLCCVQVWCMVWCMV